MPICVRDREGVILCVCECVCVAECVCQCDNCLALAKTLFPLTVCTMVQGGGVWEGLAVLTATCMSMHQVHVTVCLLGLERGYVS